MDFDSDDWPPFPAPVPQRAKSVEPQRPEPKRAEKKQKLDSRTSQQIARDIYHEVYRLIENKELHFHDKDMFKIKKAEFKLKYRPLDVSVKKITLNSSSRQLEILVNKERHRRLQAKMWMAKVKGDRRLIMDIFPTTELDIHNGPYPNQCSVDDFIENVLQFDKLEYFEDLESMLSEMSLFVSSMKFKFTHEYKAHQFICEIFSQDVQEHLSVYTDGLFERSELNFFSTNDMNNEEI